MINDSNSHRQFTIRIFILVVLVIFVLQLFNLQIIHDYGELADGNALLRRTLYAPRGLIYDRNGELLVYNHPTYDLMVTKRELRQAKKNGNPLDTAEFCRTLSITPEEFEQRMRDVERRIGYSSRTPQRFMTQITPEEYAVLQEKLHRFPGFTIQTRTLRSYSYPVGAHALGSIGEVSKRMIERDSCYRQGDYAGVSGIEKAYEKDLRGQNGVEIMLRDVSGRVQGHYKGGAYDVPAVAGKNLTLTLDYRLQAVAEQLLQGKRGSIVAIEPATGEVLALASNPTWNPDLLVGRQRSENYAMLLNDPTKPLLNRAIQGVYSPGSTFKTLQALVCLQEGGITEQTLFACNGPGSQPIRCIHHHGSPVSLAGAIEQSCNPYFWQAYKVTLERGGYGDGNANFKANYDRWRNDAISFGLGPKFDDSDIIDQVHGGIPRVVTYDRIYGPTGWRALTIRSNAIGQGEVQVTPLQLANMAAAIANDGVWITPHLNRADSLLKRRHKTNVDAAHFAAVKEGMWRVCEYGTGRWYKLDSIAMCGKTGTVDNSHGKPHSLFIGFAPKDNPKIAVAVVIENAGFGATWANPIASLVLEQYLCGEIRRKDLFDRMSNAVTAPDVKKY